MTLLASARVARAEGADPFPDHPRLCFVFVNHVTTHPFFVPTQYGLQDACDLLGCGHQRTGSANSDVAEMVNAMNAAKASAIAVPVIDPKAFNHGRAGSRVDHRPHPAAEGGGEFVDHHDHA